MLGMDCADRAGLGGAHSSGTGRGRSAPLVPHRVGVLGCRQVSEEKEVFARQAKADVGSLPQLGQKGLTLGTCQHSF